MERDWGKLKLWMIRRRLEGRRVDDICSHARVPRRTFYDWWGRYKREGFDGLELKSRRPETIHRTPENIKEKIIEVREKTILNEKAIVAKLGEEGIMVSHCTVYRTLKERGLIEPLKQKRKQKTYRRWSRKHPNSLWQTDLCI